MSGGFFFDTIAAEFARENAKVLLKGAKQSLGDCIT